MNDQMMSKDDSLAERLRIIRAKRGYLLPHHGLMAVSAPALLDAYDQTYSALTLEGRSLSRHDHEAVWLAVLIATRESLASHHIAKFYSAGGTDEEFKGIMSLAAFLEGFPCYEFVSFHWHKHLPGVDPQPAYFEGFDRTVAGMDLRLSRLISLAVHTCHGHWQALAWQIKAAYQDSIAELDLAETLSLTMFPGSVPRFVRAAATWQHLILSGEIKASDDFRAWAEISGQGGYDQALQEASSSE
jgi:alkylhydroperoxidase/carboxymuconolactone decarboxylase family protein YurZ